MGYPNFRNFPPLGTGDSKETVFFKCAQMCHVMSVCTWIHMESTTDCPHKVSSWLTVIQSWVHIMATTRLSCQPQDFSNSLTRKDPILHSFVYLVKETSRVKSFHNSLRTQSRDSQETQGTPFPPMVLGRYHGSSSPWSEIRKRGRGKKKQEAAHGVACKPQAASGLYHPHLSMATKEKLYFKPINMSRPSLSQTSCKDTREEVRAAHSLCSPMCSRLGVYNMNRAWVRHQTPPTAGAKTDHQPSWMWTFFYWKSLNLPQKTPQPTLPEEMGRHQMVPLSQECGTEVSMHLASCSSLEQECEEGGPKPANNTHVCHLLSAASCRHVLTLLLHTKAMLHDTEKFCPPVSASLTHTYVCMKTCIVKTARAGPCKDGFCVRALCGKPQAGTARCLSTLSFFFIFLSWRLFPFVWLVFSSEWALQTRGVSAALGEVWLTDDLLLTPHPCWGPLSSFLKETHLLEHPLNFCAHQGLMNLSWHTVVRL